MGQFIRWWETLGKAERIVALAIGLSAPIAIINSAVWAFAVAYMSHQKAQVDIARLRLGQHFGAESPPPGGLPLSVTDSAPD